MWLPFFAHQSVEKLLKALFAVRGRKVPKTHYIDDLAKELRLEDKLVDSISELTIDYTFSRYPDVVEHVPYEEYDEEIAKEKVKIAKGIFESLKGHYKDIQEG